MLHKALSEGWFDEACLVSGDYLVPLSDEELAEEEEARGKRTSRKAKAATSHDFADPEPDDTYETRFEPRKDWLPARFKVQGGMIWGPGAKDGDEDIPLCQPFRVIGRASNVAGDSGAVRIISFVNENGAEVEATVNQQMTFHIQTNDADSFRKSSKQVAADMASAGQRAVSQNR